MKKLYIKLKSVGVMGLIKFLYYYLYPRQLVYYSKLRDSFKTGIGLEIGGPSSIFGHKGIIPVYLDSSKIDNINFSNSTVWEGHISDDEGFVFNKRSDAGCQYIGEASNLEMIEDSSYDFILSSHCIEHIANPIKALEEWIRVLKQDGLLVLVVPHKEGTFDHQRPVTSFEHLIQDFENQIDESDLTHVEEILKLHDLAKDPGAGDFVAFEKRSKCNRENRCLHHHVFDTKQAVEMVNYVGLEILAVEMFTPYHIVIISKKTASDQFADNRNYRDSTGALYKNSPFALDRITA
ncbi:MAG: class I SAM-dependent methyltransferase [Pseudomonadales bacterium]|nr:class I SAM-dependent methyltransferase [Pseudomonadales bacterium]